MLDHMHELNVSKEALKHRIINKNRLEYLLYLYTQEPISHLSVTKLKPTTTTTTKEEAYKL